MRCQKCGAPLDPNDKAGHRCQSGGEPPPRTAHGTVIQERGLECPFCRVVNAPGAQQCKQCGSTLPSGTTKGVEPSGPQKKGDPFETSDPATRSAQASGGAAEGDPVETARQTSFHLVEISEGRPVASHALGGSVRIGRVSADINIDDPKVSREHCRLDVQPESVRLVDLESTNGVYVRVKGSADLRPGDEIMLGQRVFRLESSSDQ